MSLTPEDIDAQRQYAEDTGADLDSLKSFTREHLDYLRYRGTPLEEEKKRLANEREMQEQKKLAPSTKNKNSNFTPSVRAPTPSIPVRGLPELPKNTQSAVDKKIEDVIVAIKSLPESTDQAVEEKQEEKSSELTAGPTIEPILTENNDIQNEEKPAEKDAPLTVEQRQELRKEYAGSGFDFDKPAKTDDERQRWENIEKTLYAQMKSRKKDAPAERQLTEEPTKKTKERLDLKEDNPTSQQSVTTSVPQASLTINNPATEIIEDKQTTVTNNISPSKSKIAEISTPAVPEPENTTAIRPTESFSTDISTEQIPVPDKVAPMSEKVKAEQSPVETSIIEQEEKLVERAVAEKKEQEIIEKTLAANNQKQATEDVLNQERDMAARDREKEVVSSASSEGDRKQATEDILSQERDMAARDREKEVIEDAGMENISKQLKSVRELFGSFATKKPETNGLDIKAAVTLMRPIADTLVAINTSVLSILNRLGDLPTAGSPTTPVLNKSMGASVNTATINDGIIDSARDTFRAHSSVAFSSGPRSTTPGFMV